MAGENIAIPASRTITLSSRANGETAGDRPILFKPGEVFPVLIETARIAGQWIYSADNVTVVDVGVPTGELDATYMDVRDSGVLLEIDASVADSGDSWRVLFDLHPTVEQTIKVEISVEVE